MKEHHVFYCQDDSDEDSDGNMHYSTTAGTESFDTQKEALDFLSHKLRYGVDVSDMKYVVGKEVQLRSEWNMCDENGREKIQVVIDNE